MLNVQGMTNTLKIGAKKPCGKECMILAINADLEYEDGKKVPKTAEGVSADKSHCYHDVLIFLGLATPLRYHERRVECKGCNLRRYL